MQITVPISHLGLSLLVRISLAAPDKQPQPFHRPVASLRKAMSGVTSTSQRPRTPLLHLQPRLITYLHDYWPVSYTALPVPWGQEQVFYSLLYIQNLAQSLQFVREMHDQSPEWGETHSKSGWRGKGQVTQAFAAHSLEFWSLPPEVARTHSCFEKITLAKMWPDWRGWGTGRTVGRSQR